MLIFFQSLKTARIIKSEITLEAAPYKAARELFQREVSAADLALHQGKRADAALSMNSATIINPLKTITGVHWLSYGCAILTVGVMVAGLGNLLFS